MCPDLTILSSRPTVDRCLSRQDDHHKLQASIGILQVPEHGLYAVSTLRVLAEAWLALDGHARVPRNLPELFSEGPAAHMR